jgi:hypothetical protein
LQKGISYNLELKQRGSEAANCMRCQKLFSITLGGDKLKLKKRDEVLNSVSHHTEKGMADQTTFRLIDASARVPLSNLNL